MYELQASDNLSGPKAFKQIPTSNPALSGQNSASK
jgi:hypothetical protein